MYFLFLFVFSVFSHPFENNLVGHQLSVDIQESQILLDYDLELPAVNVQNEYLDFEKKHGNDKKLQFVQDLYKEILSNLQLEINEEVVFPTAVSHDDVEARNKGKFMVFSSRIQYALPEDLKSLSIVNQNRAIDPAIYKNEVIVSQKWNVADTDMIVWKDNKPHASLMKEWMIDEQHREIRLSFFENSFWSCWEKWWNEEILLEDKSLGLWPHLKRQNQAWFDDWKQGRTSLFSFLVLLLGASMLSLFQQPVRKWEILTCFTIPLILFFVPLSWDISIYLMYLFLCLGIILGVFRQELAFYFWLWSFSTFWIFPKYLALILGLPIFLFAKKGRKNRPYTASFVFVFLLISFYILTNE